MAPASLREYMEVILSGIPNELLTDNYYSRLLEISSLLPVFKHGIIELYENPYTPRVDLMVGVVGHEESRRLEHWLSKKEFGGNSGWLDLYKFCKSWTKQGHLLNAQVSNIYLVFDNDRKSPEIPHPWIYTAFHNLKLDPDTLFELHLKGSGYNAETPGPEVKTFWRSCFHAVEAPSWIFGFGFLNSRGSDQLRVGIMGFPDLEMIYSFLTRIEWEGDVKELTEKTTFMKGMARSYVLALDLGPAVSSRVGIECELSRTHNRINANNMITALKRHVWFDTGREKGLLHCIGREELTVGEQRISCERWLNHLKLTYTPGQPLAIKPYLYYNLHFLK